MMMNQQLLSHEFSLLLEKLRAYCAYQERCHHELRKKAAQLKMLPHDIDRAIAILIEENFLNEERFAQAWVGGKMRIKRWGKKKLQFELKHKGLSNYILQKALSQYTDTIETDNLNYWFEKKYHTLQHLPHSHAEQKLTNLLMQKGFDYESINTFLKSKFPPV